MSSSAILSGVFGANSYSKPGDRIPGSAIATISKSQNTMLDPLLSSYDIYQLRDIAKEMNLSPAGDKRKTETYIRAIREAERVESPKQIDEMQYLDFKTPISFGGTAQYLPQKCVTRRDWKDSHVAKFMRAWNRAVSQGKELRLPAIDKAYYARGKQIGWVTLTEPPYKEALKNMRQSELLLEGGMCSTRTEFINTYFKGDAEKEVWVIRFKFHQVDDKSHNPQPEETLGTLMTANDSATDSLEIHSEIIPFFGPEIQAINHKLKVLTSQKSGEHYTPQNIIDAVHEVMGEIDLDPMSCAEANKIVRAARFYDKNDNGLTKAWIGRVWLNPAFSLADEAVANLLQSYLIGVTTEAMLLIKAAPDTNRHQMLAALPFCEIRGRVKFIADGNNHPAPFAILVFYLGKNFPKFREIFSRFGNIRLGQTQVDELENDRRDLLAKVAELQLRLAKKSEVGEPDQRMDWMEDDICDRAAEAESRLRAFDIDYNIPQFEILSRQRVEWTAKLELLRSLQKSANTINTAFFSDSQIERPPRSKLEEMEGWRSEFAIGKLVCSADFTASIERYCRIRGEWIGVCRIRENWGGIGREFVIKAEQLFADFIPYKSPENLPPYRLGSVRSGKELKHLFKAINLPNYPREIAAPDGSIWQGFKERGLGRCAITWRCEVLPNGDSRVPRIAQKKMVARKRPPN